ncbi:E3 ubiquitin-protein ligase RSL1-like [Humulus lupulus]|uniref:E3 ubiquitin-protein ligase RSL1-like n=1 Tax=Humulus lupulus TaxID=3486 RepID=UPI002B412166|nr:E3 ubiquitin-protein ligase RSL1-like [Humulus lupulus]
MEDMMYHCWAFYQDGNFSLVTLALWDPYIEKFKARIFQEPSEMGETFAIGQWDGESTSAAPRSENGQSSNSNNDPSFVCKICAEPKSGSESFSIKGCSHSYCSGCMARYVASKLQDNITRIDCPVSCCTGSLEPEYCHLILPPEVFDRWGTALCEALILGTENFYCPYKDCSVMLIDDGKEVITNSECPSCYRMFCTQCKAPWHEGIECAEFQKLNKDERENEDIMLKNLAQNKKWKRCPTCKYYVERSFGCLFIHCRSHFSFPLEVSFMVSSVINYLISTYSLPFSSTTTNDIHLIACSII